VLCAVDAVERELATSRNAERTRAGFSLFVCEPGMLKSDLYRLEIIVFEIGSAVSLFLLVAQRAMKEFERTLLLFLSTWNTVKRALSRKRG